MGPSFPVHLVGSVPLADAEAVFQACARLLGDRLSRLPDGETGYRSDWLTWQLPVFRSCPEFEVVPADPPDYRPRARVRLRKGVEAGSIRLERLGYAAAARQSYALFERLKRHGKLTPRYVFQVSLPTPVGPVGHLVAPESQAAVEPVYEQRLLAELDEILEAIPHDQLAIQWDTAIEFALLEGVFPSWFEDLERGVVRRLLRLARRVPADVQLGLHLCYGDARHRHFKDPEDASRMVAIAGQLSAGLERPINWVHMPVPRQRVDDAYFAPLRDLNLGPGTELYLGLVHYTDGVYGAAAAWPQPSASSPASASPPNAVWAGGRRRPSRTSSECTPSWRRLPGYRSRSSAGRPALPDSSTTTGAASRWTASGASTTRSRTTAGT